MSIGSSTNISQNGTTPSATSSSSSSNESTIIIRNTSAETDAVTVDVPMEVVHEIPSQTTTVITTTDVITTCSSNNNGMSSIRKHVPIAILGYSYRLPGGLEKDDDFFNLLATRGYVQELIEDRYGEGSTPWDGFGGDHPSNLASPWEGLIRGGRELEFDCSLFGISVHDAKRMDPQIKMMLMTTWEALQCAGMDQAALHNSNTGVFTGIQTSSISGWRPLYGAKPGDVPGKSGSMIANRISFHFNWMGPSFSVATACSSGITALDVAVKSLDVRECDLAAFGAVLDRSTKMLTVT
jgi:acyl transferase domain-containing protein